ncbi:MAG: hypothetical protein J5605_00715, partial [Bacteroidales bacterium]|nr:hypothetical protein [Bacteroidales bacterium]
CKKEDKDYAAKITGTYLGTNNYKTETSAKVVITRSDDEYVTVQYDIATEDENAKDLAPVGFKVRVKKNGDNYTLSGSSNLESIDGVVSGSTLKMKVYYGEEETSIVNFVGTKQ